MVENGIKHPRMVENGGKQLDSMVENGGKRLNGSFSSIILKFYIIFILLFTL